MKSHILNLTLLAVLITAGLSFPIPRETSESVTLWDIGRGLGVYATLLLLCVGFTSIANTVNGAIQRKNNLDTIDRFFGEMRKLEAQKYAIAKSLNQTQVDGAAQTSLPDKEREMLMKMIRIEP
jgi:hypothetical protein